MAATVVCNYNNTNGYTRRGHGSQSMFMNGCVHHYMWIASSTMQNCGISYFIFDDIASLAGSAERQNVDPTVSSDICQGLKNENTYCRDLRFLGVEAPQRAEGNIVIPRMVDQVHGITWVLGCFVTNIYSLLLCLCSLHCIRSCILVEQWQQRYRMTGRVRYWHQR
jgi:hypothetical protein